MDSEKLVLKQTAWFQYKNLEQDFEALIMVNVCMPFLVLHKAYKNCNWCFNFGLANWKLAQPVKNALIWSKNIPASTGPPQKKRTPSTYGVF